MEYRVVPYQAASPKPHLMTPPASQACGCWESMSTCGTTRTDAAEAHVTSPASWTTRGKDHPTAHLLDLVPGRSGTVHENWLAERGKDFRAGVRIGGWIPSKGQQERHRLASSKTQPASSTPFTSSSSPVMPQVRYAAASSKTRPDTADAKRDPLYQIRLLLRASHTQSYPASTRTTPRSPRGR